MRYDSGNIFFEIPPLAIDNNDIVSVCPKKNQLSPEIYYFSISDQVCVKYMAADHFCYSLISHIIIRSRITDAIALASILYAML